MLSPPPPISTEPNGIPVGETPPGDEDDGDDIAADEDAAPPVLALHVPDVAALPGNGVPVPTPNPPPSKFVLEPEAPADGLPMAEHIVPVPVIPVVSVSNGLSPGDASSVAPMDRPTGGTDEPGVMPSGEVVPIPGVGLPTPPTCANTGLQPKSAAAVAAIKARRIVISFILCRFQDDTGRLIQEMHPLHAVMPVMNSSIQHVPPSGRRAWSRMRRYQRSLASSDTNEYRSARRRMLDCDWRPCAVLAERSRRQRHHLDQVAGLQFGSFADHSLLIGSIVGRRSSPRPPAIDHPH
jgi:hypothetical protein